MLETYFPNLYGWLIWGGGYQTIRTVIRWISILAFLAGIFLLGRCSAS